MQSEIKTSRVLDLAAALNPIATVPFLWTVYYLLEPSVGLNSLAAYVIAFILGGITSVGIYMWRMQRHLAKTWRRNFVVCGLLAAYWFVGMIILGSTDSGNHALGTAFNLPFGMAAIYGFFHKTEIDIFHYDGTFSLGGKETTLQQQM